MSEATVILGLGSNLPGEGARPPAENLDAAVAELSRRGVDILAASPWYRSAPVPPSDQPWFVNGVVLARTSLSPEALLKVLHEVEREFGRQRHIRDEARILDLDILDYDGRIAPEAGAWPGSGDWPDLDRSGGLVLPHPRMHGRLFVLKPLMDVLPTWRHPVLGKTLEELIAALPAPEAVEALD